MFEKKKNSDKNFINNFLSEFLFVFGAKCSVLCPVYRIKAAISLFLSEMADVAIPIAEVSNYRSLRLPPIILYVYCILSMSILNSGTSPGSGFLGPTDSLILSQRSLGK